VAWANSRASTSARGSLLPVGTSGCRRAPDIHVNTHAETYIESKRTDGWWCRAMHVRHRPSRWRRRRQGLARPGRVQRGPWPGRAGPPPRAETPPLPPAQLASSPGPLLLPLRQVMVVAWD
jgi:hypothetical protein